MKEVNGIIIIIVLGAYFTFIIVNIVKEIYKYNCEKKRKKDKDNELNALSIKLYGKPYKDLNEYEALCIIMYGKHHDELSGEEQHDIEICLAR